MGRSLRARDPKWALSPDTGLYCRCLAVVRAITVGVRATWQTETSSTTAITWTSCGGTSRSRQGHRRSHLFPRRGRRDQVKAGHPVGQGGAERGRIYDSGPVRRAGPRKGPDRRAHRDARAHGADEKRGGRIAILSLTRMESGLPEGPDTHRGRSARWQGHRYAPPPAGE
jgi:hypothetical protein